MSALYQSELKSLPLLRRGKVRDLYAIDTQRVLIVASDRVSAFDVILPDPIPGRGEVLTAMSNFWFTRTAEIITNHLIDTPPEAVVTDAADLAAARARAVVARRLKPLPVEFIVRGYLAGSGWRDYQATGQICGIALPRGLPQAAALPDPIVTPSTKAEAGAHDENIDFAAVVELLGDELAERARAASLTLYTEAAAYAQRRGIIIADTKFEFGVDDHGKLFLIDEILTPDSSRMWARDAYQTGVSPPSFDKQYLRDYLETLDWDKTAPAPRLPAEVIACARDKYREIMRLLTGPEQS